MRKRIVPVISTQSALRGEWLNLEGLAEVQLSSEDSAHPIEAALAPGMGDGWRAAETGPQTIRMVFDNAQDLSMIHLVFVEERETRTQEFVLCWAAETNGALREIVRQQYNFTPVSSEVEAYTVELRGVKWLELKITPSISGGGLASLAEWRLR